MFVLFRPPGAAADDSIPRTPAPPPTGTTPGVRGRHHGGRRGALQYIERVAEALAPGARAPDIEETVSGGGADLHVEHFRPRGEPSAALIAVHGFTSHAGLYRHVAHALSAEGLAVTAFDCRGHGRSSGRRGYAARFSHFVDDLERVVERSRATFPDLPLVVMGHSHGATIALDATLSGRLQPARLVLATPYLGLGMKVPAWKRHLGALGSRVWPTLALANGIRPQDISRNPAVIAGFWKDPLVHHVATARWFHEVCAAQRRILGAAAGLAVPTLVLVAGEDRLVLNDACLALAAAAPRFVRLHRFERLYHELFLEPEWAEVVREINRWLRSPASAASDPDGSHAPLPAIL
jgi:lysophospholipase